MKKHFRRVTAFLFLVAAVAACASPIATAENQSSDQMATLAAMTLQALAPQAASTPASALESSKNLLPHRLYFLGRDSQAISQLYRLERDGMTKTQLTAEPVNVWDYDVSALDGSIAYEMGNQLVLVNADGSNRRVLVEGVPDPDVHGFFSPTFSPDGQTLAFAYKGLNLYSISTGTSKLVIADQMQDPGNGQLLAVETYSPEHYSPDGKKLLVALGHWEVAPSHAVYYPDTNTWVRYEEPTDYIYCCSFYGGPAWSPDSSSFYGVASAHDFSYKSGELWKVDATNGAVTRTLKTNDGMLNLPEELYPAPDGHLYFFLGMYHNASGFFEAPVLQMVRSAPDGVTDRTVLRNDNFVLMEEALWAPDASFVIVTMAPDRNWQQDGGVLEMYYTDGKIGPIWLAPFGREMRWGP